jgi:hypothetical protein
VQTPEGRVEIGAGLLKRCMTSAPRVTSQSSAFRSVDPVNTVVITRTGRPDLRCPFELVFEQPQPVPADEGAEQVDGIGRRDLV